MKKMNKPKKREPVVSSRPFAKPAVDEPKFSIARILGIVLTSALLVVLIIFAIISGGGNKTSKQASSDTITVDGTVMKLIPAEDQINEIKEQHPEVEKCTYDQKTITCVDVANDKTEYQRGYIQNFQY